MVSPMEGSGANFAERFAPDWRGTGVAVGHVGVTGSTNADLLRAAAELPAPVALVADHQTAGRGRLDRRWEAPPGANLLVSVLLRPPPDPVRPHLTTLAAGIALADAVMALTGLGVRLKWPNDLVLPDGPAPGKLAGVLAESRVIGDRVAEVVVGMGCNIGWPVDPVGHGAPPGATSVAAAGGTRVDRDDLLEALLTGLADRLGALASPTGAASLRGAWLARADTIGRRVRVRTSAGDLVGEAVDLTDDGGLVVRAPDGGAVEVSVGDVEHLRPV